MLQWKLVKQMEKSTNIKTFIEREWKGPKDHSVQTLGSAVSLRGLPGIAWQIHKLLDLLLQDRKLAQDSTPLIDPHFFTLTLESRGPSPFKVKQSD